jgi:hypothetical protein
MVQYLCVVHAMKACLKTELHQLQIDLINANVSLSRGKRSRNGDGATEYTLNDPFTVKNTPKYWKKFKYEMNAKLENLGPFQWVFTLSCADRK